MTDHPRFQLEAGVYEALVADRDWPVPAFWEFNFVYGMNGSGKTSLARAIETGAANNGLVAKRFDREYVYETLALTNLVSGLWVVSPEAQSLVKQRDALSQEQKKLEEGLGTAQAKSQLAREHYSAFLQSLADELRPLKRKARGNDASTYSGTQVEAALREHEFSASSLAPEAQKELLQTIEQEQLGSMRGFGISEALQAIQPLIEDRTATDVDAIAQGRSDSWTTHERAVVRSVEGSPCPFCEQTLTSQAVETIRRRPSSQDHSGRETARQFEWALQRVRDGILHEPPDPKGFHHPLAAHATRLLEEAERLRDELVDIVPAIDQALDDLRRVAGGESPPAWLIAARALRDQLEALTELMSEHETARRSQNSERLEAFKQYEAALLQTSYKDWKAAEEAKARKANTEAQIRSDLAQVQSDLDDVAARLRGLMPPDVLNDDLRRYLGHDAIRFVAHADDGSTEPGYRVIRSNGQPAKRLSEGELTAVALLYFLRDCRTTEATAPPDVVVIDDPVTSLDDAGVFSAHAFIKDALARNHGTEGPTVIILTHNHAYFRLLAEWAWTLNKEDRDTGKRRERAKLLETLAFVDDSATTCRLRPMSDAAAGAGTEYAILMARLVEYRDDILTPTADADVAPLEMQVAPNIARRVLEGFLAFKYGASRRDMMGNLLDRSLRDPRLSEFSGERRERLSKLLNANSHGTHLIDSYQVIASRTEIRNVISDVLDLIATVDPDHYQGFAGG